MSNVEIRADLYMVNANLYMVNVNLAPLLRDLNGQIRFLERGCGLGCHILEAIMAMMAMTADAAAMAVET